MEEKEDRRSYIRVKDKILLGMREISPEEFRQKVKAFEEGSEMPWSECAQLQVALDISVPLKKLKERDELLASILEALDQKLTLIMNKLGSEGGACDARPVSVDLSAAGIAFTGACKFKEGELLELDIGLLPQRYFFKCFGKVVRIERVAGGECYVGLEFAWITEDDRERLIEHTFQKQVMQLRMRRQQKEAD